MLKTHCILCESEDLSLINLEDKYYYCNQCGLIFIERDALPNKKTELKNYQKHENTHDNDGYVNMFEDFYETLIKEHIDGIKNVLEYGCGPGPVLADILQNKGLDCVKYDPFFFPERGYINKKYDLITSTEVFEHFVNPKKEINGLIKLMKAGSFLAIMTLFHPGVEKFKDWWYRRDRTHVVFYNLKTFQYIEKKYFLKILKTDEERLVLLQKTK
ncbi:MAG: class I SAM-dependent methyltransferase [Halanaerobiales bacterium]|nr:class I SAM-dependent methyltransferase [Halanaerobiales bacterium]